MRSLIRLLPLVAVVALLAPATPAQAAPCTPKRGLQLTGASPLRYTYDYSNCGVPDIDQERTNLPGSGLMYCVPTATMDWFVWLANRGYLVGPPGGKNWLAPANFNLMSGYLIQLGQFMGTSPTDGTDDLIPGAQQFMDVYSTGGLPTGIPFIAKIFQTGSDFPAWPHQAAIDAVSGDLVLINVGFFDSKGTRTGGHEVALAQSKGDSGLNVANIGVRDPNTPGTVDGVQAPYVTDPWKLKRLNNGNWSVNGSTTVEFDGYTTIEPVFIFSFGAGAMSQARSGNFALPAGKGRSRRLFRVAKVKDFAIPPLGLEQPFVRAGSNEVFQVSRFGGKPTRFAAGPAGPTALAYGGPKQTLFVAGKSHISAFNYSGRKIGSARLSAPLDSLAYDDAHSRLVGISTKSRKLYFLSRSLRALGSESVPSALIGKTGGAVSIDVTPAGGVLVHRSGRPAAAFAAPSEKPGGTPFNRLALGGVSGPGGFAIDDRGQILVAAHGHVVVMDATGKVIASGLTGMPAIGQHMHVSRSFSNLPKGQTLDFLPPEWVGRTL